MDKIKKCSCGNSITTDAIKCDDCIKAECDWFDRQYQNMIDKRIMEEEMERHNG